LRTHHSTDNKPLTGDTDNKGKGLADGLAGVINTVKSLGTNGPYICVLMYGMVVTMLLDGFLAFGAKYLQQQLQLTSSIAGIVFGTPTYIVTSRAIVNNTVSVILLF